MSTTFDFSSYLTASPSLPILTFSSTSLPNSIVTTIDSLPSLSSDSYSSILLSTSSSPSSLSSLFPSFLRVLSPSSSLYLHCSSVAEVESIQTNLLLNGFIDVTTIEQVKVKENAASEEGRVIKGTKPNWSNNSSAPLAFLKNKTSTTPAVPSTSTKWQLTDTMEDDLIDEDDLLEREQDKVIKKPIVACGPSSTSADSTAPKRKACKGCSCGLAEEEAAAEKNGLEMPVKKAGAGCGSCGLGDAFRCSTCPFLGKPAFSTTGDKVKLQL